MSADLVALQANIKVDPDGYADEFSTQLAHYHACLDVFALSPGRPARELGELAMFVAQVSRCYPDATAAFAPGLAALLTTHGRVMDPATRAALAKALILLRNRGALDPGVALPVWLSLLALPDKALRSLVTTHMVADVKRRNAKGRDERLNRAAQGALRGALDGRGGGGRGGGGGGGGARSPTAAEPRAARCALGVLTDLWRRRVWRDARTANAIAAAALHPDEGIALAALKFFLGEDAAEAASAAAGSDSDEDGGRGGPPDPDRAAAGPALPSGRDILRMTQLGTASSKKKKKAKLARVRRAVAKAARRGAGGVGEGFAAIQLLHDPQTFAESLFARLKPGSASSTADGPAPARPFTRSDARTAALRVVSRVVGTHRLLLLNFYPHVQRALAPHARDVTLLIAALVQATHELVPPDALAPVLRQLVDGFVHDRARPEVAVLGLNAVRELCARAPAIMDADLLSDLALYRKARDKEVASAARGIVSLFREVAPALLAKKDRGRGADMAAAPLEYGAAPVADRVPGAELLEAAVAAGKGSEDDDGSEWESLSGEEGEAGGAEAGAGSEGGEPDGSELSGSEEDEEEEKEEEDDDDDGDDGDDGDDASASGSDADAAAPAVPPPPKRARAAEPGSLSSLRRAVAAAAAFSAPAAPPTPPTATPIEQGRILDDADFARIRALQHAARVKAAMAKHGLKTAAAAAGGGGGAKRARLEMAAEDEAEEAEAAAAARALATERALDPASLEARRRGRQDKDARLARVMEGREGRAFGAAAARHKRKTGGLSNRQLQKRKAMPLAAAAHAAKRRAASQGNRARGRKGPKR